jgi:hypothetical protein
MKIRPAGIPVPTAYWRLTGHRGFLLWRTRSGTPVRTMGFEPVRFGGGARDRLRGSTWRRRSSERELAAVESCWSVAAQSSSRVGRASGRRRCSRQRVDLHLDWGTTCCARGSELEAGFAFGVVLQLFERRLPSAQRSERALMAGQAGALRPLLLGERAQTWAVDTSFAVLHGLHWLTVNFAVRRPVWSRSMTRTGQTGSRRAGWRLVPRLERPTVGGSSRCGPPRRRRPKRRLRHCAPRRGRWCTSLLSEGAVGAIVRAALGPRGNRSAMGGGLGGERGESALSDRAAASS